MVSSSMHSNSIFVMILFVCGKDHFAIHCLETCRKLNNINLRGHKSYISYLYHLPLENAFDNNPETFIHTYPFPTSSQYLDNGYEWLLVELNKSNFQMVEEVIIVPRTDVDIRLRRLYARLTNIEILVANQLSHLPIKYQPYQDRAASMSWTFFESCGIATNLYNYGQKIVNCSHIAINSNYISARRLHQHEFCCFDFAELKVNLLVQLGQPSSEENDWNENDVLIIKANETTNCALPSNLRLVWKQTRFDGSIGTVWPTSTTVLTITNASRHSAGFYHYEIYTTISEANLIYKSNYSGAIFFTYAAGLPVIYNAGRIEINSTDAKSGGILQFYEGEILQLNCESTKSGYPVPKVSIHLDNSESIISSNHKTEDEFGGEKVRVNITSVAKREWHNKLISCNLEQQGFPNQTKSLKLQIYLNPGLLTFTQNNECSELVKVCEGETLRLNCSTTKPGYPVPTISINLGDDIIVSSDHGSKGEFGGELVSTGLTSVAKREWHNKLIICTLRQQGFPSQTKSITLKIYHVEFLNVTEVMRHRKSASLSYNFTLFNFVKFAYPEEFNLKCFHNRSVIKSEKNITKMDLYLQVRYVSNSEHISAYNCIVEHSWSKQRNTFLMELIPSQLNPGLLTFTQNNEHSELVKVFARETLQLNCSTTKPGYPVPTISINLGDDIIVSSNHGSKGEFGSELVSATLTSVAKIEWHNKLITCTLQQQGFSSQTKSITLLIYHVEFQQTSEMTYYIENAAHLFSFTLTGWVRFAYPNQFNLECFYHKVKVKSVKNIAKEDVQHLNNVHPNDVYNCTAEHTISRQKISFLFRFLSLKSSMASHDTILFTILLICFIILVIIIMQLLTSFMPFASKMLQKEPVVESHDNLLELRPLNSEYDRIHNDASSIMNDG